MDKISLAKNQDNILNNGSFYEAGFEKFYQEIKSELKDLNEIHEEEIFCLCSEFHNYFLNIYNEKYNKAFNLDYFYFRKEINITTNSIFFINLKNNDDRNYDCVVKIRREGSPLSFEKEINFLKVLENKNLIPKQILNKNFKNYRISIEEYMEVKHIEETEVYNKDYLNTVIEGLCEFNLIDYFQDSLVQFSHKPEFYFNFLIKRTLPYSRDYLSYIENKLKTSKDEKIQQYNIEVTPVLDRINNFLKNLEILFEKIYSSLDSKFPYFVFSFIDLHLGNFFIENEKIKFIDFEDLSYCFIGYDLANHLIESEYIFTQRAYPFFEYNIPNLILDEKIIRWCYDTYIDKMNLICGCEKFKYLSIQNIYCLFMLVNIKSVIEYILMIKEDCYNKASLDYLRLIEYKISVFEKYYELLYGKTLQFD